MIAWAVTAAVLMLGFGLVAPVSEEAASAWRTVTRAFIVAPMTLVALTVLLSLP